MDSSLTDAILARLEPCPLSRVELMEDLDIGMWAERELLKALRQLEAAGQVERLEAPAREGSPFYGRSLNGRKDDA